MLAKTHLTGATWTLADQGVVSLGTFLINVILARELAPAEYGIYALIYGALLTLQLFSASLFFYPLSVRLGIAVPEQRATLAGASVLLTAIACVPLSAILAAILVALGRADLAVPVLTFFVLWQIQEAVRRCLLADFRHRSALPGDAVSYVGQAVVIFLLTRQGPLPLAHAIYVMAITSGLAALIQTRQLTIALPGMRRLLRIGMDFWHVGSWSLANNFVSIARIQIFPWTLAWLAGPAAVASFQAAFNVANLVNPIMIGLCNLIPQTAARAHPQGKATCLARGPAVCVDRGPAHVPVLRHRACRAGFDLKRGLWLGITLRGRGYAASSSHLGVDDQLRRRHDLLLPAWR